MLFSLGLQKEGLSENHEQRRAGGIYLLNQAMRDPSPVWHPGGFRRC
jgi:hypothetical protein